MCFQHHRYICDGFFWREQKQKKAFSRESKNKKSETVEISHS